MAGRDLWMWMDGRSALVDRERREQPASTHHHHLLLLLLHPPQQVWTRLQAQGRPPNPRYKHQAVRGRVLSYVNWVVGIGAVTTLQHACVPTSLTPQPQTQRPSTNPPTAQVVVGDSMYVLGGGQYSPEEGPMDIHRLDLEHMIWFQHDLGCMAPQARIAHTYVFSSVWGDVLCVYVLRRGHRPVLAPSPHPSILIDLPPTTTNPQHPKRPQLRGGRGAVADPHLRGPERLGDEAPGPLRMGTRDCFVSLLVCGGCAWLAAPPGCVGVGVFERSTANPLL